MKDDIVEQLIICVRHVWDTIQTELNRSWRIKRGAKRVSISGKLAFFTLFAFFALDTSLHDISVLNWEAIWWQCCGVDVQEGYPMSEINIMRIFARKEGFGHKHTCLHCVITRNHWEQGRFGKRYTFSKIFVCAHDSQLVLYISVHKHQRNKMHQCILMCILNGDVVLILYQYWQPPKPLVHAPIYLGVQSFNI